jgi:hypothetical protein
MARHARLGRALVLLALAGAVYGLVIRPLGTGVTAAQALLAGAGLIFLAMGTLHGLLAVRDVTNPREFTPTEESVRIAMQGTRLAFNPRVNLWEAWLGFNLSHSVGVVLSGGCLLFLAGPYFPAFAGSHLVQGFAAGVAAVYLILSLRFGFGDQPWGRVLRSYAFSRLSCHCGDQAA